MPRLVPKIGPVGLALAAWDVWRRLPPAQRKQVVELARRHGPTVASKAYKAGKAIRKKN